MLVSLRSAAAPMKMRLKFDRVQRIAPTIFSSARTKATRAIMASKHVAKTQVQNFRRTSSRQIAMAIEHAAPSAGKEVAQEVAIAGGIAARAGRAMLRAYLEALQRQPLLVKTLAAIAIFGTGDAIVQTMIEGKDEIDLQRLVSRACSGAVFVFWVHPWWNFLEPRVGRLVSFQTNPWANTMIKVFLDQTIGALSVNLLYMSYISAADGMSTEQTIERIQNQLPSQMMAHWSVFPLFHTLNFRYVPLQHRVLTQNFIGMGWAAFLSYRYRPGGDWDPLNKHE